ncbi:hypothetical protein QR680_019015 [Steinernema hermaphroditum]|uniref:acid phosphatase n=1 Tax=Steinernema hermaphroditum TaxID=289476 RepID=A0AA39HM09_9BILA|nr:hypothetical protein QR680_019015 [Steinernema hermaphroditum]
MWPRAPLIFFSLLGFCCGGELVHVQAVWRHGDRTPARTYRNDPNQEDKWPLPWGELTTRGMTEQYQQGLRLKERYIDNLKLISKDYKSNEIYVRSTDKDRTLMSAYANLAGFYSDSIGTHPNSSDWPVRWSPIPVHSVENHRYDYLLNPFRKCPRKEQLEKEREKNLVYQKYWSKQKEFLDNVSHLAGKNISARRDLHDFLDTTYIEKLYNLTLPAWLTDELYNRGWAIKRDIEDYLLGSAGFGLKEDVELVRLQGGPLLTKIIENMKNLKHGKKYHAYSAHDITVFSLIRTLGANDAILNHKEVDYAAVLVMELWTFSEKYYVRLLYSASANHALKTYTRAIKGCPNRTYCPLDTFIKRSKDYMVENPAEACNKVDK